MCKKRIICVCFNKSQFKKQNNFEKKKIIINKLKFSEVENKCLTLSTLAERAVLLANLYLKFA